MRYTFRHVIAVAICLLLAAPRAGWADDAENSPAVHVSFKSGDTEIATLTDNGRYYSDKDSAVRGLPLEVRGLKFTCRKVGNTPDVTIDAPSGSTVFLILGNGAGAIKSRQAATDLGWTVVGYAHIVAGITSSPLAVYKQVFDESKHVIIPGSGLLQTVVAARSLDVENAKSGSGGDATETTSTLHIDKEHKNKALPGPSTRPSQPQATVNALEVYEMQNGLMLGQTSEATLTLTASDEPQALSIRFVTKIGNEMSLARNDALRYIHLKYPNWYVSKAEITFEDKYVAHDGGSIGTALGTLILSCIQGFTIDPNAAITGDISANGKTRAIGGVSAKIKGATASKCTVVAIPVENSDQLVDAVIYSGPELVRDIQVIGINNLDDAVATVRTDRDPKLAQAITLFAEVQKDLKDKPTAMNTKGVADKLEKILQLAPQHLSAQVLLSIAQKKQPKTLSPAASQYYTFLSVGNMVDVLKQRSDSGDTHAVPSSVVRTGLANLRKLRPLADENVRPLIDAWCRFIEAWNSAQQGYGSSHSLETQRQSLLDEMAKEKADADLMQKMLKEGM